MGLLGLLPITVSTILVGATTGVVLAVRSDASSAIDIWTLIEKGGAPMAGVMLLALVEVVRRHDRAYRIIEAKDATILAMSERSIKAIETTNEIAKDQMKIAHDTHVVIKELVTLLRGKLDIG